MLAVGDGAAVTVTFAVAVQPSAAPGIVQSPLWMTGTAWLSPPAPVTIAVATNGVPR